MNFLKKIFQKKDVSIKSYADFWAWFQKNEKEFFDVIKDGSAIERDFFDKLSPKLDELKKGYYYLTGMYNSNTAELIITADGDLKNIVFVEELVEAAPKFENWKITAFNPPLAIEDVNIDMGGYEFNKDNIYFYGNEHFEYPDEVDISIIHDNYNEENQNLIVNGIYIFLDNYLGELNFLTNIDNLSFVEKHEAQKELIPIAKLKDFLLWREKEFLEKHQGMRSDNEEDNYSLLEAQLPNENFSLAFINTDLLEWDSKASHPWIGTLIIEFDGSKNNGMPNKETLILLEAIEDNLNEDLKAFDGYLNIGRQTAEGTREIYFACKDFRKPSKIFFTIQKTYADRINIDYKIYKDKYWQTFERFNSR